MQPGTSQIRRILTLRESEIILRNILSKTHGAITKRTVCMQTDRQASMDPVTAPGWSITRLIHILAGRCIQTLWLMGLCITISGRSVKRSLSSPLTPDQARTIMETTHPTLPMASTVLLDHSTTTSTRVDLLKSCAKTPNSTDYGPTGMPNFTTR
jgi:hypothetical protein